MQFYQQIANLQLIFISYNKNGSWLEKWLKSTAMNIGINPFRNFGYSKNSNSQRSVRSNLNRTEHRAI